MDDLTLRPLSLDAARSEEHTSELQSQSNLVCRLLLEKKKNVRITAVTVFVIPCDIVVVNASKVRSISAVVIRLHFVLIHSRRVCCGRVLLGATPRCVR